MMKGLLIVLVLLVVVVVGLGFYLGWFHFSTGGTDSTPSATITVDQNKIDADKKAAQEKVKELEEKAKAKTGAAASKDNQESPKP